MNKYTFNNIDYYLADDVYNYEPETFTGCSKTTRLIIKNKKLKEDEYIYMKYIKSTNEWRASEETYKSAKVFIIYDWVHKNLIKFKNENQKTEEDFKIEAMKAPPLLELSEEEKFVDNNGNKLDIEIRGTRDLNNIFFKVKDVADNFDLGDVTNVLLGTNTSFKIELHYKLFKIIKLDNVNSKTNKRGNNKLLFLTFKGLTKLLYVSHSKNAEHFQDWANNIIYTHQFGTQNQKLDLVGNVLGINAKIIKEVFNTSTNTIPCIYLFSLNTVKELRSSMSIDDKYADDSIVCKYGFTKDLSRRTSEHIETFNKINNCDLILKYHSYIDPQYISKGESDIRLFMEALNISFSYKNFEELVIIPKNLINLVQKQYEQIGKNYMGHIAELITKIKDLEDKYEKQELKHKIEIQKEQEEKLLLKHQLELQKEKYENEIMRKEIAMMKMQMNIK